MGKPYRHFDDGALIRSDEWNQIQTMIKQEIRTHRHGGGAEGESDPARLGARLRSEALLDNAVTTEKIAENAVTARVLAAGSVGVAQFRPDAAIDETKVAFDPDEPAAHATAKVVLQMPAALAATPGILWAIPKGAPVTNDAGDLVFRTSEPVTLDAQKTTVEVTARAEEIGVAGNVPAGTLTRIGGALDPFLRNHLRIAQLGPSQGGAAAADDLPPLIAWAEAELRTEDTTPPTFWVVPKGTRVWHQPADGSAPIVAVTRQSLSVFPRSAWVLAECTTPGAGGNLAAGSLRTLRDAALAARVAVDQPDAGTGGDAGAPARVRLRLRLFGALAGPTLVVPAATEIEAAQGLVFRTLSPVTIDDGGVDHVLADLEDAARPVPAGSLTVDPAARLRLDKIHDPSLVRYLSAERDETFPAPDGDPRAIRLRLAFSARAPRSAWSILAGTRVTVSRASQSGGADDPTRPVPLFETQEALAILARSGWVRADALTAGSDFNLPAGTLNTVVSLPANPALAASLDVDQPADAVGGELGFAWALVRFRVIESTPLPAGLAFWEVPTGTVISDGQGKTFATREPLLIYRGGAGMVPARSLAPGEAGNVRAGTLDRVHPDTLARIGNVVDRTLVPYLGVAQPEDADGGGEELRRARTTMVISVSERAPRTAWFVPRDTRVARAGDAQVIFETVDPTGILPRTGWALAAPVVDTLTDRLPAGSLTRLIEGPPELTDMVEVYQPEEGESGQARVWFRVFPDAVPKEAAGWRVPAGAIVGNASGSIRFATLSDVVVGDGGAGIAILEADRPGTERNGIDDLRVLASVDDFEKHVQVTQQAPAKEGADGGSQGHHHKLEDGALGSAPLAAQSVGPDQMAQGAVSWSKLSPALSQRLQAMRDQLQAVEDAMVDASALQALMKQRHQDPR
jgi:Baseplate J-like protein